jgi:transposase
MTRNTVIAGLGRRRWAPTQKLQIIRESLAPEASVTEVARRHNLRPNLIYAWRHQAKAGALSTTSGGESRLTLVRVAAADSAACPIGSNQYTGSMIEVVLRNGRVLRLSESAAPARVAPLADALEGYRP